MADDRVVWDQISGSFIVSGYRDARSVLSDNTLWKDPDRAEPAAVLLKSFKPVSASGDYNASMLWLDGDEHARVRGPFAKAFAKRVPQARDMIEAIVERQLAETSHRRTLDGISDYAAPIPVDVILAFLGAEKADLPLVRNWAASLNKIFQPQRTADENSEMAAAMEKLGNYLDDLVAERRKRPRDDLVSDIVSAPELRLSGSEVRVNFIGLVTGGILTTTDLIGNALRLFALFPGEREKLLANPAGISDAIEEVLRLESPVEGAQRVLSKDLSLSGCPVRRSQVVVAAVPRANRDPDVFREPERFDIARERVPHLSFGGGAHICLGAPLARLEGQIAVLKFLQRFPRLRLAHPDAPPKWRGTPFFHGLEELPLAVGARDSEPAARR